MTPPPGAERGGRVWHGHRTAVGSSLATVLSALPPFLLGSLTPIMRADVDIDTGRLGVLVAMYFFAAAIAAVPGGRLAERLGPRRGLYLTGSVTTASLLMIALAVDTWVHLAVVIVVAGFANGMVHPAGNLAIVRGVSAARRGAAFGIKQAAAPLATLLAGLAIPAFALTLGWRSAFLAACLLLPLVAVTLPRDLDSVGPLTQKSAARADGVLLLIAVASALAFGAATTVGAFLVDSVVSSGGRPAVAGASLTAASAAGIGVRLFIGWKTDRMREPSILLVAGLMAVGSIGFVILALSPAGVWPLGAIVGMGAGWGWPGLLYHAVAHAHPDSPAAATAVATTGNALGAALGPLVFGLAASQYSFAAAWIGSGTAMLVGGALMVLASRSGRG